MPEGILSILTQLPVVAAFVYYSMWSIRSFQEFMREERCARQEFLIEERCARQVQMDNLAKDMEKISDNLTAIHNSLNEHDRRVSQVAVAVEKTLQLHVAQIKPRGAVR